MIQGRSIAESIRAHLIHLTSSKRFLRAGLSTRWGLYVWKDLDYFSVDNHLLNSPCLYRGRPITESNIQVGFQILILHGLSICILFYAIFDIFFFIQFLFFIFSTSFSTLYYELHFLLFLYFKIKFLIIF